MDADTESERPVVVHYSRYWLPAPASSNVHHYGNVDLSRVVEVVLEPHVLWFCLLRKVVGLNVTMLPTAYDQFVGGPLPAAFVNDPACYSGQPLRQERLMQHMLLNLPAASDSRNRLLRSDFLLYESQEDSENIAITIGDTHVYHDNNSILPVYVEKHLRYAVLYLLWVYPKISQNVTKNVVVNSMPFPHGYYVYYVKVREITKSCEQCGYSNLEFTIKELSLMLKELQRILRSDMRPFNYRPGYWLEGSIFANLAVLFSIPCHGIEELLVLHREFYDLKAYCVRMNRTYKVVDLKPPFLCEGSSPAKKALDYAWEKLKDSQFISLLYKRTKRYKY